MRSVKRLASIPLRLADSLSSAERAESLSMAEMRCSVMAVFGRLGMDRFVYRDWPDGVSARVDGAPCKPSV